MRREQQPTGADLAIVALAHLRGEMAELAERAVVALHMHFHAGLNKPGFDDCRKDLCGDWHRINSAERIAKRKKKK